ncbi:MAG: hypothetical protein BWY48_00430 [Parcubacteria group bacterium ADurb.Bin305]|nr:MAG: hypothetical protein BWY48_00430 [Parcubacteria group bacterium ADurb.Bin305]
MENNIQKLTAGNFTKLALIIILIVSSFVPVTMFLTWVVVMWLTIVPALKLTDKTIKWFFIVSYLLCELIIWIPGIIQLIKGSMELEGLVFYFLALVNLVILALIRGIVALGSDKTKNLFFIFLSILLAFIVIFLILQSILL